MEPNSILYINIKNNVHQEHQKVSIICLKVIMLTIMVNHKTVLITNYARL